MQTLRRKCRFYDAGAALQVQAPTRSAIRTAAVYTWSRQARCAIHEPQELPDQFRIIYSSAPIPRRCERFCTTGSVFSFARRRSHYRFHNRTGREPGKAIVRIPKLRFSADQVYPLRALLPLLSEGISATPERTTRNSFCHLLSIPTLGNT